MVKTTDLFLPNPTWKAIATALLHPAGMAMKWLPDLHMQDNALKSVQQNPFTVLPAKDKYICVCYFKQLLQKERSWSNYSDGSSGVHFFIIA